MITFVLFSLFNLVWVAYFKSLRKLIARQVNSSVEEEEGGSGEVKVVAGATLAVYRTHTDVIGI